MTLTMNVPFEEPTGAALTSPVIQQAVTNVADQLWSALRLDGSPPATPKGLALPSLTLQDARSVMQYAVTAIDVWGRIADRSLLQALGWRAGRAITVSVRQGAIAVRPSSRGQHHITGQGHLRVPASVRHLVHLDGGDRLLLAASPAHSLVVAYPTRALDAMLVAYHSTNGARP